MDYLKLAIDYTAARNDDNWFRYLYTCFREYNNVKDSVWKTLSYLYSNQVADELEQQTVAV